MPQVQTEVESFARIRVIGVGGSGSNAINHMINSNVKGVEFIAVNTDAQDLHHSQAKKKVHIGKNLTRGLGAGGNPDSGKRAAEETQEEILETLEPLIERYAKERKAGEGFGDFCVRVGIVPAVYDGRDFHKNPEGFISSGI